MAEFNKGLVPPKTIRISTHDLLVTINRVISGDSYKKIKNALERLKGVSITTNIKTNKRTQSSGFGLIDSYNIIKSDRVKDRIVRLEITLSDWFYNSIIGKEVLTINRDYFRLRQPLERRIYEIARKHCGVQDKWQISVDGLHKKTGSRSSIPKFFFSLKKIVAKNILPDYHMFLDKSTITFQPRNQKLLIAQQKALDNHDNYKPVISTSILEKAKEMTLKAGTGWDFYAIVEEFTQFTMSRPPQDYNKAFIGFVKKKVANRP
jgi:plasmid replication initiation protein